MFRGVSNVSGESSRSRIKIKVVVLAEANIVSSTCRVVVFSRLFNRMSLKE